VRDGVTWSVGLCPALHGLAVDAAPHKPWLQRWRRRVAQASKAARRFSPDSAEPEWVSQELRCDLLRIMGFFTTVARPLAVNLDAVAERYARATAGIGTDQLWTALKQYGAARSPLV
jgi:hypothetical protein